jgi:hypothetical protein
MAFVSCEDILDVEPALSLDANTAIKDKNDLIYGITGCYNALQFSGYYGRSFIVIGDLSSDNAYNGGTIKEYGQINNNSILADNAVIDGTWYAMYIAINRVNTIIYQIGKLTDLTADEEDRFLAELRFLRALHYFNLVRTFGEVPLKLEATIDLENVNVPLSSVDAIYTQIMDDLSFAEGKLTGSDKVRATDMAVKALQAKVYLERGDWDNAVTKATEIITGGLFTLVADYATLFSEEDNSESIFEVSFTEQEKNRLAEYFFPSQLTGRYEVAPTQDFIDSYEAGDERADVTILEADKPYVNKYEQISLGNDNVYVFRLAEIHLLRAEANARKNQNMTQVQTDINLVRTRAGLAPTTASTYADLLQVIEDERRHEFAFEGHRWFDLVRTNRAIDVLPNVTSADQYLLPIPLSEINTNDAIN